MEHCRGAMMLLEELFALAAEPDLVVFFVVGVKHLQEDSLILQEAFVFAVAAPAAVSVVVVFVVTGSAVAELVADGGATVGVAAVATEVVSAARAMLADAEGATLVGGGVQFAVAEVVVMAAEAAEGERQSEAERRSEDWARS